MTRRLSVLAAALGAAFGFNLSAHAADAITFDPTGTAGAAGNISNVAVFDWAPGNTLALDGNPQGGLAVGDIVQTYYQANLSTVIDAGGNNVFTNGVGGNFFTVVAGYRESVQTVGLDAGTGAATVTFGLAAGGDNFFQIYANTANGNNLTGFNMGAGSAILSGSVTTLTSSTYGQNTFVPGTCTVDPTTCVPVAGVTLDQFINNDWATSGPGGANQLTVVGSGSADITITVNIASVNQDYFPDLVTGAQLVLSFFNTSLIDPYNQADPSKCFYNTTNSQTTCTSSALGGNNTNGNLQTLGNLGAVNGGFHTAGGDFDFIFQSDGNQSFTVIRQVPEPGTLALLGLAVGAAGVVARRRKAA